MRKMMVLMLAGLVLGCMASLISSACMAAEQARPITLKLSLFWTENSWVGQNLKWWVNEVEKRTGGRVKVQAYWMESLTK
jgi:TRAP-type C4-dicarboxylate transport system substrate-binding protein